MKVKEVPFAMLDHPLPLLFILQLTNVGKVRLLSLLSCENLPIRPGIHNLLYISTAFEIWKSL